VKKSRQPKAPRIDMTRATQQVFHALAAPPRREILKHLAASGLTAGEISSRFDMAKPSISQHLTILETAGLISREKRGQFVHYALVRQTLADVLTGFMGDVGALPPAPELAPAPDDASSEPAKPTRKAKAATTADPDEAPEEKPLPTQMSMF
jgi:DNA-binding transcriptional ArsR family regulator